MQKICVKGWVSRHHTYGNMAIHMRILLTQFSSQCCTGKPAWAGHLLFGILSLPPSLPPSFLPLLELQCQSESVATCNASLQTPWQIGRTHGGSPLGSNKFRAVGGTEASIYLSSRRRRSAVDRLLIPNPNWKKSLCVLKRRAIWSFRKNFHVVVVSDDVLI